MKKILLYILFIFILSIDIYGASITVDGDLSDWTNQLGLTNVAEGADGGGGTDILTNGVAADANNLYFYFIIDSSIPDWNFLEVYIDTNNVTTDGASTAINGDALTGCGVEYGFRLQSPLGDKWGNDWAVYTNTAWNVLATDYLITHATNAGRTKIEMSVPLSQIGVEPGDIIGIRFHSRATPTDDNPSTGEIIFAIPLSPPVNINAISIADTKVKLFWDAVPGVTSYTLYRASSLSGPTNKIGGTTGTAYTDIVANAFTSDYYYWVKSFKGTTSSPYSEYAMNSTGYPTINVDGNITEWTQSRKGIVNDIDNGADNSGGLRDIQSNKIANDDSNLYVTFTLGAAPDPASGYRYEIYIDIDNNSATGVINTPLTNGATALNGTGSEYMYRISNSVEKHTNAGGSWSGVVSTSLSYTISGNNIEVKIPFNEFKANEILPGSIIRIAFIASGQGWGTDQNNDTSEISYCIVGGTPPPAPVPSNVVALIKSDSSITISWSPSTGATGYKVYRNSINNPLTATLITSGITTTYYNDTVTSALSSTYYYWVKAEKSGASDSNFSSSAEAKAYFTIENFDSYANNSDLSNSWSVYIAWNASSRGNINLDKNNLYESNSTLFYVNPAQGVGNDEAVVMQKSLNIENHTGVSYYVLWTKGGNFPSDAYFYFGFNNYQWDSTDNATFTTLASNYIGRKFFKQIIINKNQITADSTFSGWDSVGKILLGVRETDTGGVVNTSFYIDKIIALGAATNILPSVSSTSPANNSDYVISTTTVPVSFTIGADMTNIIFQVITNNNFYATYREPLISYDGNVASLNINLPEGTNRVIIDAENKITSSPLKQYILTFRTIIAPSLKNLLPPDNSHQISTNTNISFNLLDNKSVLSNTIYVEMNNNIVISNGKFLSGWNGVNSSISRVNDVTNYKVVIDKTTPLLNNSKYTLYIAVQDNNGNLSRFTNYFYTKDTITPFFGNINPSPSTVIRPDGNIYFETKDNLAVESNSIIVRIGITNSTTTNYQTALSNGIFQTGYSGNIVADGEGGFNVTLSHNNSFSPGSRIYISINFNDYGNNSKSTNFFYNVQSDFTPPITTPDKDSGSYIGAINVTLNVTDESPYWLYWTEDGSDPLTSSTVKSNYNSSVTIQINKNKVLKYYSKDIYGNKENVKTSEYEILKVPADKAEVYNNYCNIANNEKVRIAINEGDENVVIRIYNIKGEIVWEKEIGNSNGRELIEWDGKDSNGKMVNGGVYIVLIKGNKIDIKRKIIVIK